MRRSPSRLSGFVSALASRALLRQVGAWLRAADIPVMPLKGVLLQSDLYGRRWQREMSDVDVLVPEDAYGRAIGVLRRAGCACLRSSAVETFVQVPGHAVPLDLHRRMLLPGTFGLATAGVFARARVDDRLFGDAFHLPDGRDVYAHLLGHFVQARTPHDDRARLDDFWVVARADALQPSACARHLYEQGLGRAARYLLPALRDDAFAQTVLRELPSDPIGDHLASAARALLPRIPRDKHWGMLGTHALGRSLPRGLAGAVHRTLDCTLSRLRIA